jgi:predicted ribosomally synthesized peptide with nif11-like leader
MSDDQFKAFLEAVEADAALQEKVQTEANRYADAVVAIAKEAGFGITPEAVKRAQLEISEDDLEGVTGGQQWDCGATWCASGTPS